MEYIYEKKMTNASMLNDICSPVIQLGMIRYEVLFDFLSEEPNIINITRKKDDEVDCMEQIFRTRRWGNNTISSSLSIFSTEREWGDYEQRYKDFEKGIVIREVIWDMKADVEKIKNCSKMDRKEMLQAWPKVYSNNYWINMNDCKEIIHCLINLDKSVYNNVALVERNDTVLNWKNFEIRRLFDWGCIHNIWSPQKVNIEIEEKVLNIEKSVKNIIEKVDYSIYLMDLDFSIEPDSYKKNIIGRT